MATLLLSAAGAALGSGVGGTILGLTGAVVGRAVGATLGRVIDQKILGLGSDAIEIGRVDRFRMMGASEGAAIPRIWGRMRVAGQVIWASRFQENVDKSGGGKGSPRRSVKEYSYSVSLAIALCEGEILRVGRVWADGYEIEPDSLNLRVYRGDQSQLPDPKIVAVEGGDAAPAYRGIAYVVLEDLELSAFGNRVPQFSFEVIRPAQGTAAAAHPGLSEVIPGVCLIPGTGEYALATTPVHFALGLGKKRSANVNTITGKTDFSSSLDQLTEELPNCSMVSLVSAWFASDLRCASCTVKPKVEQRLNDGVGMAWRVSDQSRALAEEVPKLDGRSIFGGTPTDQSIVEAIEALKLADKSVTFYPFLLMDQLEGNALHNPWDGSTQQPAMPWRGRITLNDAPGQPGSTDGTAAAEAEVAAFFGTAAVSDFAVAGRTVHYLGPQEWSYRRFILHHAHLCAAAGGVSVFCIGTEMRSLTQIRGTNHSFPAVEALRILAGEVKSILGAETQITYAADWSEYFGYHIDDNVYFHLDPLWADPAIDFIGIDNYMPVTDWRSGPAHADVGWGDIHDIGYITANIAGGEGYDWYYANEQDAISQTRTPIIDSAHGEDWVFRYKDLKGWWSSSHHNRIDGVRLATPTAWIAASKPMRFTEYGCAAIDRGTNQPNLFLDPKSSESAIPRSSTMQRDDLLQLSYHQAMHAYWQDPVHNPDSGLYDGRMLDFAASTAWAWDARPFPAFPAHEEIWADGPNYDRGHWLNGRSSNVALSALISEVCETAGVPVFDTDRCHGIVRGYGISDVASARSVLQPLTLAFPTDATERAGVLHFVSRMGRSDGTVREDSMVMNPEMEGAIERARSAEGEVPALLRLTYLEAEASFAASTASVSTPEGDAGATSQSELPLVLTQTEATLIAERWTAEARAARETVRFALPRSMMKFGAADTIDIDGALYRIDRLEQSDVQTIEAVRVDPDIYDPPNCIASKRVWQPVLPALPVFPLFFDVPVLRATDNAHAPYACVAADPWTGPVALWSSSTDTSYRLNTEFNRPATLGLTETELTAAQPGCWDRGPPLRVRLESGTLSSAPETSILSGANAALIGDGSPENWEIFQFASATLVGPQTYDLVMRLRGQNGTDALIPPAWPIGSIFVLLNEAVQQIDVPLSSRGLTGYYRFVQSEKDYSNPVSVLQTKAFAAVGLRPYSVSHLCAIRQANGDLKLSWIRRSRLDADTWNAVEIPLGEDTESFAIQVWRAGSLVREERATAQTWLYDTAQQASDLAAGTMTFSVAQISQSFGKGPSRSLAVDL